MKLNPSSWHARLYLFFFSEYFGEELPNNLCSYFWYVILACFLCVLVFNAAFLMVLIISFVTGLWGIVGFPWDATWSPWYNLAGTVLLIAIIAFFNLDFVKEGCQAIKDRYCPLIEWENEPSKRNQD